MFDFASAILWAAESTSGTIQDMSHMWIALGIFLVATIVPYFLGVALANGLKVPEYGNKIGFILVTIGLSTAVVLTRAPKFGIDLSGGAILVYQVDEQATAAAEQGARVNEDELVAALTNRLNPGGVNEIQVRKFGERQVEVIVPNVSEDEKEIIKRKIADAGQLEFLILANDPERDQAIDLVLNNPALKRERYIRNAEGQIVGQWVHVNWNEDPKTHQKVLGDHNSQAYYRDAATGELLLDLRGLKSSREAFESYLRERKIRDIEALMVVQTDPDYQVGGSDIYSAMPTNDNFGNPIVRFTMKQEGGVKMGMLTGANISDKQNGRFRHLGIVLDGNLRSAPSINSRISDSGVIEGSYTPDDVKFLVETLRAGKLPAVMQKEPISENQISPLLGADTILKGQISIGISMLTVLIFMAIYYRFSGFVACVAVLMNLLLTVGSMILISAAFTLPGLAGMVLSVGMSVDANVLIYERMREELARGAALRMAIRNGFSRAMTTIIDSNLTTIITAVVLYVIGTEQLKGFAVTLILGIIMSMFTAIFVARVIFDIAERRRFITKLNMMDWWGKSNIDFVKLYWPTTIASIVVIAIGLVACVVRQEKLFDIDFNGGTSIEMLLAKELPESEVRKRISAEFDPQKVDYTVTEIAIGGQRSKMYKIDTSIDDVNKLEQTLEKVFVDDQGRSLLAKNAVTADVGDYTPPAAKPQKAEETKKPEPGIEIGGAKKPPVTPEKAPEKTTPEKKEEPEAPKPEAPKPEEPKPDETPKPEPPADKPQEPKKEEAKSEDKPEGLVFRTDVPATLLAQADDDAKPEAAKEEPAEKPADKPEAADTKPDAEKPAEAKPETATPDNEGRFPTKPKTPEIGASDYGVTEVTMTFEHPLSAPALYDELRLVAAKLHKDNQLERAFWDTDSPKPTWIVDLHPDPLPPVRWNDDSGSKFSKWKFGIGSTKADAERIVAAAKQRLEEETVWNSSSKIGGKVASKTRYQAVWAVLASLIGIIGYVWFRFHKLSYGVAAVVALVHDVLVTVGLIAVSAWLAPFLGFLQVEEFKISLTVVAAILTLIGYSLNDTIVTFDRIREVKGKSPELTPEMINRSINETLSRTFLTAGTTLIVVVILYFMGGSGIHGFAFSMLVGVIAGTYSSVFIAAPLLLWMRSKQELPVVKKEKAKASA